MANNQNFSNLLLENIDNETTGWFELRISCIQSRCLTHYLIRAWVWPYGELHYFKGYMIYQALLKTVKDSFVARIR